jgi:hypothetical protein
MSGFTPQSAANTSSGRTNPEEPTPKSARTGSGPASNPDTQMAYPMLVTEHADRSASIEEVSSSEPTPTRTVPELIDLFSQNGSKPVSVHSSPRPSRPISVHSSSAHQSPVVSVRDGRPNSASPDLIESVRSSPKAPSVQSKSGKSESSDEIAVKEAKLELAQALAESARAKLDLLNSRIRSARGSQVSKDEWPNADAGREEPKREGQSTSSSNMFGVFAQRNENMQTIDLDYTSLDFGQTHVHQNVQVNLQANFQEARGPVRPPSPSINPFVAQRLDFEESIRAAPELEAAELKEDNLALLQEILRLQQREASREAKASRQQGEGLQQSHVGDKAKEDVVMKDSHISPVDSAAKASSEFHSVINAGQETKRVSDQGSNTALDLNMFATPPKKGDAARTVVVEEVGSKAQTVEDHPEDGRLKRVVHSTLEHELFAKQPLQEDKLFSPRFRQHFDASGSSDLKQTGNILNACEAKPRGSDDLEHRVNLMQDEMVKKDKLLALLYAKLLEREAKLDELLSARNLASEKRAQLISDSRKDDRARDDVKDISSHDQADVKSKAVMRGSTYLTAGGEIVRPKKPLPDDDGGGGGSHNSFSVSKAEKAGSDSNKKSGGHDGPGGRRGPGDPEGPGDDDDEGSGEKEKGPREPEGPGDSNGPGGSGGPSPPPKRVVKEGEKISLLQYPTLPQLLAWKQNTRAEVVAVSGMGQKAFTWITRAEDPEVSIEELMNPGDFESLDAKFAAAIGKIMKGEAGRRMAQRVNDASKKGIMLTGRAMYHYLLQDFEVSLERGAITGYASLKAVTWCGDDNLETFRLNWEQVEAALVDDVPENIRMQMYYDQIKDSKKLSQEIGYFNRLSKTHEDKTLKYLKDSLQNCIDRERDERNQKGLEAAMKPKKEAAAVSQEKKKEEKKKQAEAEKKKLKEAERKKTEKAAAAVSSKEESKTAKGFCFDYQKGKCSRENCQYKHEMDPSSQKKKKEKPAARAPTPEGNRTKSKKEKKDTPCKFFQKGACSLGDACEYSHNVAVGAVAVALAAGAEARSVSESVFRSAAVQHALPAVFDKQRQVWKGVRFLGRVQSFVIKVAAMVVGLSRVSMLQPRQFIGEPKPAGWMPEASPQAFESQRLAWATARSLAKEFGHDDPQRFNVPAPALVSGPSKWVLDSGSANHMCSRDDLDGLEMERIEPLQRDVLLSTGNGIVKPKEKIDLDVVPLKLKAAEHIVMKNSPAVLSLGRVCADEGYDFYWKGFSREPVVGHFEVDPVVGDDATTLETDQYVPILPNEMLSNGAPTAPALPSNEVAGEAEGEGVEVEPPPEPEEARQSKADKLKEEARSWFHLCRHTPKNPHCKICINNKMDQAPARKCEPEPEGQKPEEFGDRLLCDYIVLRRTEADVGREGEMVALNMCDVATNYKDVAPAKTRSTHSCKMALKHFVGNGSVKELYSDNAPEIVKAADELEWSHPRAPPYRHQAVGKIEVENRITKSNARCNLDQAGFPHEWWPSAAEYANMAENILPIADGRPVPYERRFKEPFPGKIIPYGQLVHYRPPPPVLRTLPTFSRKTIPGVFIKWRFQPGHKFHDEYDVVPLYAFQGEKKNRIPVHTVKGKELIVHDTPRFPLAEARESELYKVKSVDVDAPPELEAEAAADDENFWQNLEDLPEESEAAGTLYDPPPLVIPSADFLLEPEEKSKRSDGFKYTYVGDRKTRVMKTTRPPDILPEAWTLLSQKERKRLAQEEKERIEARAIAELGESQASSSSASSSGRPAAATVSTAVKGFCHTVIELCTRPDSMLGSVRYSSRGANIFRVTEENDFSTPEGFEEVAAFARANKGCHLWASLPCTAGSPWWKINRARGVGLNLLKVHQHIYRVLMSNLLKLAAIVKEGGGHIHFEWPKCCALWRDAKAILLVRKYNMKIAETDGCAHGVVAQRKGEAGVPIKKTWAIATTSDAVYEAFHDIRCPGDLDHPRHARCEKGDTVKTGNYTSHFCDVAHNAMSMETRASIALQQQGLAANEVGERGGGHADSKTRVESDDHVPTLSQSGSPGQSHGDAEDSCGSDVLEWLEKPPVSCQFDAPGGHHERESDPGLWCALITKTIRPWEPEFHSEQAQEAVGLELSALKEGTVWMEENVMEKEDAKKQFPDAHFGDIFALVGVKNYESDDPKDHRWKGRIVFGGHNVKTAGGSKAIFDGNSVVPSCMAAYRFLLLMWGAFPWLRFKQSDCLRAYTQAMMKGPKTFISMPRKWWPKSWLSFKHPVTELLRALYGHPKSGDIWGDKLHIIFIEMGMDQVEGWPGVYILGCGTSDIIVVGVYVDDLLMLGGEKLDAFILELRNKVEMDDPSDLSKYLGCNHRVSVVGVSPNRITCYEFDMVGYFSQAVRIYEQQTGNKLKKVDSPFAPVVPHEHLEKLLNTPGQLGQDAASYLMKLLFGARLAHPILCIAIQRLARNVSKWTAECDRRLHRLYCYIWSHLDVIFAARVCECIDIENMCIELWPDADLCGDIMSSKSTSGFFLEVSTDQKDNDVTPSGMPISWGCKKQASTSIHTAEAETVSVCGALHSEAIPLQSLLRRVLGRTIPIRVHEDNSACLTAFNKGYSPSMRSLPRTQRVSIGSVHDILCDDDLKTRLVQQPTATQKGDPFTKELGVSDFRKALDLLGYVRRNTDSA